MPDQSFATRNVTILFLLVSGCEKNWGVVTLRDKEWHVHESIVYIAKEVDSEAKQKWQLGKGFCVLDLGEANSDET
jgi:hypothetical protein